MMKRFIASLALSLALISSAQAQVGYAPHLPTSVQFTGGPIATLGTVVGGSSYTPGTYTNVPLTGGSGTGVLATVVVSGSAVTTVTVTNAGAPVIASGAIGYVVGESLSASSANIGGTGSGFSVPVATTGSYSWQVPNGLSLYIVDWVNGGAGGGCGDPTLAGAGGGGGAGKSFDGVAVQVTPLSVLTITVGAPGIGCVLSTSVATAGGLTTISGATSIVPTATAAAVGVSASGATGGAGGGGGGPLQGNGGAAGAGGANPSFLSANAHAQGGAGGGGGGAAAAAGGNGAGVGAYSAGATGGGNQSGGGGGASLFGSGGKGGASGAPGGLPPLGFGGGGGGGGSVASGANGTGGMLRLRAS